jgi:hypothetical protein
MRFASEAPDLLAEAPDVQHPLGPRHLLPVLEIVAIRFGCRFETPDGDGGFRSRGTTGIMPPLESPCYFPIAMTASSVLMKIRPPEIAGDAS